MLRYYKLMLLIAWAMSISAQSEEAASYHSVKLPPGSKLIGERRYQSSRPYEETKRELIKQFAKSNVIKLRGEEINLPHVRAIFFKNLASKSDFSGINIYENGQNGLTEIFFLTD